MSQLNPNQPQPRKASMKLIPLAIAATLAIAACSGSNDAAEPADPERAQECEELIAEVTPALDGTADEKDARACRMEGYDPVWEAMPVYLTDADYRAWRRTGDLPTCDDILGRDNPLGGEYGQSDVQDCHELADEDYEAPEAEGNTGISAAAETCGVTLNVDDDGDSISFDTEGEDDYSGDSISDAACVIGELEMPSYVVQRIDSTRALDGTQDAEWDGYAAFWNYHPDSGMNLTIYVVR